MNIILYNSKKLEEDVSLNVLNDFIKENNFIEKFKFFLIKEFKIDDYNEILNTYPNILIYIEEYLDESGYYDLEEYCKKQYQTQFIEVDYNKLIKEIYNILKNNLNNYD